MSARRATPTLPFGCPERMATSLAVARTRTRTASSTSASRSDAGAAVTLDVVAGLEVPFGALAELEEVAVTGTTLARVRRRVVGPEVPRVGAEGAMAAGAMASLTVGAAPSRGAGTGLGEGSIVREVLPGLDAVDFATNRVAPDLGGRSPLDNVVEIALSAVARLSPLALCTIVRISPTNCSTRC